MTSVYDQKTATDMYGNERYATGLVEGRAEGETEAFVKIYKNGMINANDAARMLNITVEQFLKFAK